MSSCHVLELPARSGWSAELWIGTTVSGGLYRRFGTLGAAIEVGALLAAIVLAARLRRRPGARLAPCGALLLVGAHALFWWRVAPVHTEIARWTSAAYPADWGGLARALGVRARAARALLQGGGFALLLAAVLAELPAAPDARRST